jgi:hypothetical protein
VPSKPVPSKEELRAILQEKLEPTIAAMNKALAGRDLGQLEKTLKRIGRGSELPHWFDQLKEEKTLPNLDGKTIGSVIEMLLVAVLETNIFKDYGLPLFRINPARGVDLPDLDLGVKSPSENFCTSEPFFSAYERLLGSEHDALVLITDYQEKKAHPPLKLQISKFKYLSKTKIADKKLCAIAKKHRSWLVKENEAWAKRIVKFLAYVNQSDWRAKQILQMIEVLDDKSEISKLISKSEKKFETMNARLVKKDLPPLPDVEFSSIKGIAKISPLKSGVIDAAENWVIEMQKDLGRAPNDNEWKRFLDSPLDGEIGMSLALQWRYNFGPLFKTPKSKSKNTETPFEDECEEDQ